MAATIKMKDRDKERLDSLRARLLLNGIKLNQEELLSRLLDIGENYLLNLDNIPMKKITRKRKQEILSRAIDMGVNSEDTVDDDIYGA